MAVPKNRKSKSKKKIKKLSKKIKNLSLSIDKETNSFHIRHCLSKNNYYKGEKIFK